MITLNLDWHEVLWWMQGGMSGSHLRWSVYEDMVNRVWPQCSEQERRNLWFIMRRDLGSGWRPDGWNAAIEREQGGACTSHAEREQGRRNGNGFDLSNAHGEGEWKPAAGVLTYSDDKRYDPRKVITDLTPWMYFRQVLARFDPENQYAVTIAVETEDELDDVLRFTPKATIISCPNLVTAKGCVPMFDLTSAPLTVRAYKWQNEYRIDWNRRCDESRITKVEKITIDD